MEYINGQTLKHYISNNKLDIKHYGHQQIHQYGKKEHLLINNYNVLLSQMYPQYNNNTYNVNNNNSYSRHNYQPLVQDIYRTYATNRKQFKIGSFVKGVIIKVDYHTLEIYITVTITSKPLGITFGHTNEDEAAPSIRPNWCAGQINQPHTSLRLISYSISCIIAAYILDTFVNTHKLNAFIMIIGAISTLLIGYTNDINLQYIWWIIQGFACGHIETCLPVYIYRIYDNNADNVLNVFLVIYGITKTLTPLLIQYIFLHSLFIFFFVGIIFCAIACYIPTPKYDKFRSIQKEINKQNSKREAKDVLNEIDLNYKYIKYALIILFSLILITFSCIGAGLITFITVYCSNYLKINSSIGRYLISAYFGGQLLYRMCKIIIISKTNNCMLNNIKLSINSLIIGYLGCFCMFIIWFLYPINGDENSIILLFFVFFLNGIFLSSTYPSTYQLCESITPISRFISSLFTLCIGIGDGEFIVLYPITFASVIQIIIMVIMIFIYYKYRNRVQYKFNTFKFNIFKFNLHKTDMLEAENQEQKLRIHNELYGSAATYGYLNDEWDIFPYYKEPFSEVYILINAKDEDSGDSYTFEGLYISHHLRHVSIISSPLQNNISNTSRNTNKNIAIPTHESSTNKTHEQSINNNQNNNLKTKTNTQTNAFNNGFNKVLIMVLIIIIIIMQVQDIYGTTSTNNPPPSPTYTLKTDENELLPIMYIYISMRYTSNYN